MVKAGLTGNYGSGKTLVLNIFERLGAYTISSDEIVRELLKDPGVLKEVEKIAGSQVFEEVGGRPILDKKKLAEIIFSDPEKRKKLENMLHPLVMKRIRKDLKGLKRKIAVIEVPLLFEGGYQADFDKTITVYLNQETALKRLKEKGISREDALLRLRSQMPISEKARRADFVIKNEGTPEETERQVEKIYRELLESK